jgi:uncharacterized protein YggU (UPF0235/DUF167 family)
MLYSISVIREYQKRPKLCANNEIRGLTVLVSVSPDRGHAGRSVINLLVEIFGPPVKFELVLLGFKH